LPEGKVKWFNREKGYGFIQSDDGQDIFVHRTAIQAPGGAQTLNEEDRVTFDITQGDRGLKAINVVKLA
jgi:CspA family cold shock protein